MFSGVSMPAFIMQSKCGRMLGLLVAVPSTKLTTRQKVIANVAEIDR
jgi:hypothetical protein